jgi:hypothetical protein
MTDISLIQYARILGSTTVIGMAGKVGLTPPPPPISVRNLVDAAGQIILPLAPVDLRPQNGASGVSNNPDIFFRDPGADTPAAAVQFEFTVTQNNIAIDPKHELSGPRALFTHAPKSAPPGMKWISPLPPGEVTLKVSGLNKAGKKGPTSTSTFIVVGTPTPPTPQTKTLTLQVTLSLPAFTQSILEAKWFISGPGAPQAAINSPIGGPSSQVAIPLPTPQGSATYVIRSAVAFKYDSLVRNNGISGAEDSQVDLSQPTSLPWTGQSRIALFSITYDSFNNVFIMAFDGLLG